MVRWKKVARDLFANRSRTVLSVLSIAVGVIAFGGLLIARNGIQTNLAAVYGASDASDITLDTAPFDETLVRWVMTQPGVAGATASASVNGVLIRADGGEQDITLVARSTYDNPPVNKLASVSGAYPPARGELLIERGSNSGFGAGARLSAGETLVIKAGNETQHSLRLAGVIYDVNAAAGPAATRWTFYTTLRTLGDLDINTRPTRLLVRTLPGTSVAQKYAMADRLSNELALRGMVVRATSINERGEHWAAATIDGILILLVLVGAISLVMSGFLIVNVIAGLLQQQRKIIGIMKIVGADRYQIFGVYIGLVLMLGLMALAIAIPVSGMLGNAIARFMGNLLNFDTTLSGLTPQIMLIEALVALLVPMVFAASPILSALRVTPAQAITEVNARQSAGLLERALARLANMPRTMVMATRNIFRNNTRLAMTLLTLVVAGTLFTGIQNLSAGIPATLTRNTGFNTADVTIGFGSPVDRISAVNRALQIEGVIAAEGWIATSANLVVDGNEGTSMQINGGDAQSRFVVPPLIAGRWLAPYSPDSRDEIVISRNLLDTLPSAGPGTRITLRRGNTDQIFTIVGVISAGPGGVATYAQYQTVSLFAGSPGTASSVRVATTDKTREGSGAIADALRAAFEDRNVVVVQSQNRATLLSTVINAFSTIITLLLVVAGLVAVVGGLGLAGSMSLNVMERTREVGVMRSVGAESGDLRFMFIAEGLFTGLLSALASFALSWPASLALGNMLGTAMRAGSFIPTFNWQGYLLWLLIVSTVSVLASIIPARNASRISIREALAYA